MSNTQQHLSIADIQKDLIFLKDGGGALVLETNAINFGLFSQQEQIAIVESFAQMLNSLSFPIQIVIHSRKLNITSYIKLLDEAQKLQKNPLLSQMMASYRQFILTVIKENEVLDKRFYIVIPAYAIELGLNVSKESRFQKIETILLPRKDQVVRQLNRIGLRSTQLPTRKLVELFYDIYNQDDTENENNLINQVKINIQSLGKSSFNQPLRPSLQSKPSSSLPENTSPQTNSQPAPKLPEQLLRPKRNHPFVVEELTDNQ